MSSSDANTMAKAKNWSALSWKQRWQKTWHFIWHEDSLASWLVNIVLAFLLIKFILYPGLGLVLGSDFPVVAVVSSSMEHHPGNFDEWWATNEDFYLSKNITKFDFMNYPFKNGFNKGDIMILTGAKADQVKKGTVIVYWSRKPYPIIHRFVGYTTDGDQRFLTSKGDNNPSMVQTFELNEYRIQEEHVVGKAVLRVPYLGYVKIWAVDLFNLLLGR
jgi:hypothetical protein